MTNNIDHFQIEKDSKIQWERDAAIRAEFGEFQTFLSYQKANAGGQVQVMTGRTTKERK